MSILRNLSALLVSCLIVFMFAGTKAQTISTVAGNGTLGSSGDGGLATAAKLYIPGKTIVDQHGNMFIAESWAHKIRKVDASTGKITTIAGTGVAGYNGDNIAATSAKLYDPIALALDSAGNLFVTDNLNQRIRKINLATGIITTYAGDGYQLSIGFGRFAGDGGPATAASFSVPVGIAFDKDWNFYVADHRNRRIRKVDAITGIITTIAGNGMDGRAGDGGLATAAEFHSIEGIAFDPKWNLFICDSNSTVRKVDAVTNIISTVAGNGTFIDSGDGGLATSAAVTFPWDITFDATGNCYIAELLGKIRKIDTLGIISTVAGTGTYGYNGDGIPATSADLYETTGVSSDDCGCIYIADALNYRIRKITSPSVVVAASIAISSSKDTLCEGTSVTFIASTTYGGSFPLYKWYVNGSVVGTGGSSFTYTPSNGDSIYCTLISSISCASPSVVNSNGVKMVVYPVVPSIIISSSPVSPLCLGFSVVFTATVAGAGISPAYQWYINGVPVSTSSSLTYTPLYGDSVRCELTSSSPCASPVSISSNTIDIKTYPIVTPTITISKSTPDIPCSGDLITFNSIITGGGLTDFYKWFVNGTFVGTGISYTYSPSMGDSVTCLLICSVACSSLDSVLSNSIITIVSPHAYPSISLSGITSSSTGSSVNITATVTGATSYVIDWMNCNVKFSSTSIPSVSYIKTKSVDSITAIILSSSGSCIDSGTSGLHVVDELELPLLGEQLLISDQVEIFPNPASSTINIKSKNKIRNIKLFNCIGQLLYNNFMSDNTQINIADLPGGVYIVEIELLDFRKINTKVIKNLPY